MNLITEIYEMRFDFETGIYETTVPIEPVTLDEIKEIGATLPGYINNFSITIPYYNFNKIHIDAIYYIDKEDRDKHLTTLFNHAMDAYEEEIEYHQDNIKECHNKINELDQYMKENL